MIDQAARAVLLVFIIAAAIVSIQVYRRAWRPSRRGSILAMWPTLAIWGLFEAGALLSWDIDLLRWLSRLGVIALCTSFLYQLWSIDYAERIEQAMRNGAE